METTEQTNLNQTSENQPVPQPRDSKSSIGDDQRDIMLVRSEKFLFKHTYSLEKRKQWSQEAREKFPNKLPLIVEKDQKCMGCEDLENPK